MTCWYVANDHIHIKRGNTASLVGRLYKARYFNLKITLHHHSSTRYEPDSDYIGWGPDDVSPPSVLARNSLSASSLPAHSEMMRNVVYWSSTQVQYVDVNDNNEWFQGDWVTSTWRPWNVLTSSSPVPSAAPQAYGTQHILSRQYEQSRYSQCQHLESSLPAGLAQQSTAIAPPSPSSDLGSEPVTDCGKRILSQLSTTKVVLDGRPKTWKLDTISFQLSGGKYVTAASTIGLKRDQGNTLRQIIIDNFLTNDTTLATHTPYLGYLDKFVRLVMNRCTGDATQMTLRELIFSNCAVDYICHQIGLTHESTIEYRRVTSKNDWRNGLTPSEHSALVVFMRMLLRILRDTGKYEYGRCVVWEPFDEEQKNNGFDGVVINPIWASYIEDTPDSTCFTMLSGDCNVRLSGSIRRCAETPTMILTTKIKIRVKKSCCKQAVSKSDKCSQKVMTDSTLLPQLQRTVYHSCFLPITKHSFTEPC
jgi:hypothetical protein